MPTSKEFALYSYFRSSASYRVRIAMGLKNIDYDYKTVHLINNGGEQHSAEYRRLNPSREVPTLIHTNPKTGTSVAIGQSIAIIDYLDQVVATPKLFPVKPERRALVLQACEIINSGAQPLHNLRVLGKLAEDFGASEEQKTEWTKYWIRYGLESFNNLIEMHSGRFSFGDEISAADCFLMPHLFNADRFQVSTAPYPRLEKIRETCEKIEAVAQASPKNQVDTPKA